MPMTIVAMAMFILSSTGIAMGMLTIIPKMIPCSHQFTLMALMPIVNPNRVRPTTIDHFTISGSGSGPELAINRHTKPKTNPLTVAMITLFVVNISFPSLLVKNV